MANTFSKENLIKLAEAVSDEAETLSFISEALIAFTDYHRAVFEQQIYLMMYSGKIKPGYEYQAECMRLDKIRSGCHNVVIDKVTALNRLAAGHGTAKIYDGEISFEFPYRRQIADAVFEFSEELIKTRI
jgi:hypothetical protein